MAKIAEIMELYQMRRQIEDACRAFRSLDRDLPKITPRPRDAAGLEAAIRQMEAAVDRKAAPFHGNKFVEPFVNPLKDKYCAAIREKAAASKGRSGGS